MSDKKGFDQEFEAVVASFTQSMYKLAASPVEALRLMAASPSGNFEALATLSRNLESLSSTASFAASMADLMASFSRRLRALGTPKG